MTPLEIIHSGRAGRAAELLIHTRRGHSRLRGFPRDLAPGNLEEAYEIQMAAALLRGMPLAGYKIGLTNLNIQHALGAQEPIAGRLGAHDIRRNGCRIALPEDHLRVVEAEVIFEIGRDLPGERSLYSRTDVASSIAAAYAGIELCNARLEDVPERSLADRVADNSNADLIIIGESLREDDFKNLDRLPVILEQPQSERVTGSTACVLGNPLQSVTWLANWLAQRGEGLKRGQFVASGSCTGMTEVRADAAVTASFGSGVQVRVQFSPAGDMNEVSI